jgi:hypothetical protein
MKSDNFVSKHFEKKKNQDFGRCPPQTLLDISQNRFKEIGAVISDQYSRHEIPEHRLYMIDKVVRMRSQYGRFGIDHSELLNYELELTNKPRDDHMNWLVQCKGPFKAGQSDASTGPDSDQKPSNPMNVSAILFNRLNVKDDEKEHSIFSKTQKKTVEKVPHKQTYADWLKIKEAERRLKRKLIAQAQSEVKD